MGTSEKVKFTIRNSTNKIIILLFYRVSSLLVLVLIIKVERSGFWFARKVGAQSKLSQSSEHLENSVYYISD